NCGGASIPRAAAAVLIALADQPQIEVGIIDRVIARYEEDRPRIVVPMFERRGGHPILIDLSLKAELLTFDSSRGLKQVVEAHSNDVARFDAGDPAVLADFDYPEDYARLLDG